MIHDCTDGYIETIMKFSLCNCQHQFALGRTKRKHTHESFSQSHHRDLHHSPTSQNASQNLPFSFSFTTNITICAQLKHTHSEVLNSLFNKWISIHQFLKYSQTVTILYIYSYRTLHFLSTFTHEHASKHTHITYWLKTVTVHYKASWCISCCHCRYCSF